MTTARYDMNAEDAYPDLRIRNQESRSGSNEDDLDLPIQDIVQANEHADGRRDSLMSPSSPNETKEVHVLGSETQESAIQPALDLPGGLLAHHEDGSTDRVATKKSL